MRDIASGASGARRRPGFPDRGLRFEDMAQNERETSLFTSERFGAKSFELERFSRERRWRQRRKHAN
jgi:hypothetical protein